MELLAGWQRSGLTTDVSNALARNILAATSPSSRHTIHEPCPDLTLITSVDGDRTLEFDHEADLLLGIGTPFFESTESSRTETFRRALTTGLRHDRHRTLSNLSGCFALANYTRDNNRLILATDRFASMPIYYTVTGKGSLIFSTTYTDLFQHPQIRGRVDQQSVYNYIFFSTVPGDRCIHQDIYRIPPASLLVFENGQLDIQRYWQPNFNRDGSPPAAELERKAFDSLSESVGRFATLDNPGCFLSGGLDSSAVAGLAAQHQNGQPFHAYTMGFTEAEFDETAYARIAAQHFGLELHEHQITAEELIQTIDTITAAFAEPFGNSSAICSYIGAKVAREDGVINILAGDGGDELFAGNERYQKQLVFELYDRVPQSLRNAILNPFAEKTAKLPGPFSKIASYIRQALIPLPARMFTYHLLVRNSPSEILTPTFLQQIDIEWPFRFLQSLYDEPVGGDTLDRMMFLDWTITLADNDLRKVRTTCEAADLYVHFPMLTRSVTDASLQVASGDKMTLRTLRAFYKDAFGKFLPEQILHKQKHGFGVPVGPWMSVNADLRERVYGRLGTLKERDIFQAGYIDNLIHLHRTDHAVYYGALIWPLFMLEEWFQTHACQD